MKFSDFLLYNEFPNILGIMFNIRDLVVSHWLWTFRDPHQRLMRRPYLIVLTNHIECERPDFNSKTRFAVRHAQGFVVLTITSRV